MASDQNTRTEGFAFLETGDLNDGEIALLLRECRPGDPEKGYVPSYDFDIVHAGRGERLGELALRVGACEATYYGGNIGYSVLPQHRGNHYAAKACALAAVLARRHGMKRLFIACAPQNRASRRTCELTGAAFLGLVRVPRHLAMYKNGRRCACIYELVL